MHPIPKQIVMNKDLLEWNCTFCDEPKSHALNLQRSLPQLRAGGRVQWAVRHCHLHGLLGVMSKSQIETARESSFFKVERTCRQTSSCERICAHASLAAFVLLVLADLRFERYVGRECEFSYDKRI